MSGGRLLHPQSEDVLCRGDRNPQNKKFIESKSLYKGGNYGSASLSMESSVRFIIQTTYKYLMFLSRHKDDRLIDIT
jgi:hypothetical protein